MKLEARIYAKGVWRAALRLDGRYNLYKLDNWLGIYDTIADCEFAIDLGEFNGYQQ